MRIDGKCWGGVEGCIQVVVVAVLLPLETSGSNPIPTPFPPLPPPTFSSGSKACALHERKNSGNCAPLRIPTVPPDASRITLHTLHITLHTLIITRHAATLTLQTPKRKPSAGCKSCARGAGGEGAGKAVGSKGGKGGEGGGTT